MKISLASLEKAITGAYERCATPEEVVQIESFIVEEIEKRIREGRTDCFECDISALTYHNTIKITFEHLIRQREELNEAIKRYGKEKIDGKI